jgi:hypothetical protein
MGPGQYPFPAKGGTFWMYARADIDYPGTIPSGTTVPMDITLSFVPEPTGGALVLLAFTVFFFRRPVSQNVSRIGVSHPQTRQIFNS